MLNSDPTLRSTVHPRGHGEHGVGLTTIAGTYGSSPWARGTHPVRLLQGSLWRFIPVGTGNTLVQISTLPPLTVHPRGHGEHADLVD